MSLKINRILHRTNDKVYLEFSDGDIKVLFKSDIFKRLVDWQLKKAEKSWSKLKIDKNFGDLVLFQGFDIGADTLKPLCKKITEKDLLDIAHSKRIPKKRIYKAIASLF